MVRAVFLDALGTLVELEPPWVSLRARIPAEVSDERLVAALRAEMEYYREHAHEGRDEESLAGLRERCARLVSEDLGIELSVDDLVDSIRFEAYPDTEPALRELRSRGLGLVVVSNWDIGLPRCPGALRAPGADRRRRHVRGRRVAQAGPRRSSAWPWSWPAARLTRRCTSATPRTRTSPVPGGRHQVAADRSGDGRGDIASLEEIVEHL